MDAIKFLKQEHEKTKRMFEQIEGAGKQERGQLWRRLAPELKLHEQMEEEHLYGPVARDPGNRDAALRQWEHQHHKEVGEAEAMIGRISGKSAVEEQWLADIQQLHSALEHHIEEEEGTIWPRIRQVWDNTRLEEAGRQMEEIARRHQRAA